MNDFPVSVGVSPKGSTTERPLFSMRLGLRTHLSTWGRDAFGSRHGHQADDKGWSHCEPNELLQCACPGTPERPRCCHRASQEDRLCDACRDWCLAIGHDRQMVRFIDCFEAKS